MRRQRKSYNDADYKKAHTRLGSASLHKCQLRYDDNCKDQAEDWALDWRNVHPGDLRVSEDGLIYSVGFNKEDYVATCRKCHRQLDRNAIDSYIARLEREYHYNLDL